MNVLLPFILILFFPYFQFFTKMRQGEWAIVCLAVVVDRLFCKCAEQIRTFFL